MEIVYFCQFQVQYELNKSKVLDDSSERTGNVLIKQAGFAYLQIVIILLTPVNAMLFDFPLSLFRRPHINEASRRALHN